MNYKLLTVICTSLVCIAYVMRWNHQLTSACQPTQCPFTFWVNSSSSEGPTLKLSSDVRTVNFEQAVNSNFTCLRTKTLLHLISTTICIHDRSKDQAVSNAFQVNTSIWDEEGVVRILTLLIRHPHLDLIDIGANIGTYTMYAAALGRFVLSIECFAPNIARVHRAVQLANVANRVVLVQNALFTQTGQYLRLSHDASNIGGQEIDASRKYNATEDPYIVKTIQFNDVLPILIARGIRGAILKVDIEGSESFVVESGEKIFDRLEIPFVQMEWPKLRYHPERVKVVLEFFARRQYNPTDHACKLLNVTQQATWPTEVYWIKSNASNFC